MQTNRRHAVAAALAPVLAAIIVMGTPTFAVAQQGPAPDWNDTADPLLSALGLHYGRIGGHGLAFRLPVKWWLYLQTAGGLWHTTDRRRHNLGLELNYILRQDRTLRLYLAGGAGYFYDKEKTGTRDGADLWDQESHWNYGFGVGVELLRGRRWSLQFEGNFMHNGDNGETKVTPQAGIYYYW
ncbi:MAG: hypothetical protein IH621_12250 [Krumholzibacteria bacterium]|nr:hypothetical protein [Candidatus Krumholzibacteria bacterium]